MVEFVPSDFEIPLGLKNEKFLLKPLSVDFAEKDYEAIMSSAQHIRGVFGNEWPSSDLTFKEELTSLKLHQKDAKNREAFAYTVLNQKETKCLGCIYLYPSHKTEFGAVVFLWVIESEVINGLDEFLFSTVKKWIKEKWPFGKVTYPGRSITWEEFR